MTKSKKTEREIKKHLCWGILFHMQGRQAEARQELKKIKGDKKTRDEFKTVSDKIIKFIEFGSPERLESQDLVNRSTLLLELVEELDNILNYKNGDAPNLALECERNPTKGEACDNRNNGYSRDPYREIKGQDIKSNIALASIIYLLRGYASCFCRPRNKRDYNAAKVALNDFFQCSHLIWRLYRSLDTSHSKKGNHDEYLKEVGSGANTKLFPEKSAYFIWSILLMLEVQRGNVYRQIDNLEEASRYYRHFQDRIKRFESNRKVKLLRDWKYKDSSRLEWSEFITPTVIRAFFEFSKIQFDLGHFLESLINQTCCLTCLIKMGKSKKYSQTDKERKELFDRLIKITDFLEFERRQSIFDTEQIGAYYDYPDIIKSPRIDSIQPKLFKGLISDDYLELSVDILARIGFTHITFLRGHLPVKKDNKEIEKNQHTKNFNKWLSHFFSAHIDLKVDRDINPSKLGQYCLRFIGEKHYIERPWDTVEMQFMHRLTEEVRPEVFNLEELEKEDFYNSILTATTENILNIVTIPRRNQRILMRRGYLFRREFGDLSQKSVSEGIKATLGLINIKKRKIKKRNKSKVQNKLVVLRRWQSINPKIPRSGERKLRGGGYFLIWQGKGIVIDPGYDFIQNFYDEGFSLADIDVVMITHSHPDHDDDLSTLITLIREWNEYYELTGQCETEKDTKKIDLFLNESTNLKFSAWLKSSDVRIGRVVPLPSVWWDKDSKKQSEGKIRGKPVVIDLRNQENGKQEEGYCFQLEVVPAWHDDVIGKTEAIGLKFHLYSPNNLDKEIGIVGYTGDTGAYGYDLANLGRGGYMKIDKHYADCDVLIAHLGDIRIRELMTIMDFELDENHPIQELFDDWFTKTDKITPDSVRDFVRFLIALDLSPSSAFLTKFRLFEKNNYPLCVWLEKLANLNKFDETRVNNILIYRDDLKSQFDEAQKKVFSEIGFEKDNLDKNIIETLIKKRISNAIGNIDQGENVGEKKTALALLGFLCSFSIVKWQYPHHLGIFGLYTLFNTMIENNKNQRKNVKNKIFIVGELPEELSSYRHQIAKQLNKLSGNLVGSHKGEIFRRIHALTGDIGLHISITPRYGRINPKVRCAFCDHNNETVINQNNYHEPTKIIETPIKRLDSAMIYLCTKHDHHPEDRYFLSRPNLRVI
jgi:hypothetical protein